MDLMEPEGDMSLADENLNDKNYTISGKLFSDCKIFFSAIVGSTVCGFIISKLEGIHGYSMNIGDMSFFGKLVAIVAVVLFVVELVFFIKLMRYNKLVFKRASEMISKSKSGVRDDIKKENDKRDIIISGINILGDRFFNNWVSNFKTAIIIIFLSDIFLAGVISVIFEELEMDNVGDVLSVVIGNVIPFLIAIYGVSLSMNMEKLVQPTKIEANADA